MGDPNKSFKPSQVPQHHTNAYPGPHQAMNPQPIHQKIPVTNSQENAGVPQNSQHMTPDHQNQQKQGKFQHSASLIFYIGQKPSNPKQTKSFNAKTRNNIERAPTIPEDENESLVSSFKANTRDNMSIVSGEIPRNSLVKRDSTGSDKSKQLYANVI